MNWWAIKNFLRILRVVGSIYDSSKKQLVSGFLGLQINIIRRAQTWEDLKGDYGLVVYVFACWPPDKFQGIQDALYDAIAQALPRDAYDKCLYHFKVINKGPMSYEEARNFKPAGGNWMPNRSVGIGPYFTG